MQASGFSSSHSKERFRDPLMAGGVPVAVVGLAPSEMRPPRDKMCARSSIGAGDVPVVQHVGVAALGARHVEASSRGVNVELPSAAAELCLAPGPAFGDKSNDSQPNRDPTALEATTRATTKPRRQFASRPDGHNSWWCSSHSRSASAAH